MNESSIFLLSKTGNKYDFPQLPSGIYLDTSYWNEAYGSGNNSTFRYEFHEFIKDCTANGTEFFTSGLVREELIHINRNAILKESVDRLGVKPVYYPNSKKINYKQLYEDTLKKNSNLPAEIDSEINRIWGIVSSISTFLPHENNENFSDEVHDLIRRKDYKLDTMDAKHAVVAYMWDVNCFGTKDGDFWLLDNCNIYVPPVPSYRNQMLGRANVYINHDPNKLP